jgi:lipid A 4'-phosphatase
MQMSCKNQAFVRSPIIPVSSFIILSMIFLLFPSLDVTISNLFFDGEKFPLNMNNNYLIKIIDRGIEYGCIGIWIAAVSTIAKKEIKKNGLQFTHLKKKLLYISLVGLIGGVGIVHSIKHHIVRCRPNYIEFFGGPAPFTTVWTKNAWKAAIGNNCLSFVSGHAAIGFLLYSIAFTYARNDARRHKLIIVASFTGGLFGLFRIIQGQHFLSDIIFSGYVVYFTALILAGLIKPSGKSS